MKAKEFLSKIIRNDKITIRKNTGLIRFDEKRNYIEDKGSGDLSDIELIPNDVFEVITGESNNPALSDDKIAALFVLKNGTDSISYTVDGMPCTSYRTNDKIQITQEIILSFPEGAVRNYYENRLGWYYAIVTMRNPETLTVGTMHDVTIVANGSETLFSGQLEVLDS